MKVGILAGGVGSRLSEETVVKPKPMVEIGGRPILWHIMKHLLALRLQGVRRRARLQGRVHQALHGRLLLAVIGDLHASTSATGAVTRARRRTTRTGRSTWSTPAATRRPAAASSGCSRYLGDGTFMLTWGDGVSDVDLDELLAFHRTPRQARDA